MARETQHRTHIPPGDPKKEINDAYNDFVRNDARNILDRSVLDESGEVVWLRDDDAPEADNIQTADEVQVSIPKTS